MHQLDGAVDGHHFDTCYHICTGIDGHTVFKRLLGAHGVESLESVAERVDEDMVTTSAGVACRLSMNALPIRHKLGLRG